MYEYSLLEQRYRALEKQYFDLQERVYEYEYATWGRRHHETDINTRQLQKEANDNDLHARLSILGGLMPFMDEGGYVDTVVAKLERLADLGEEAGGENRLRQVVENAQFLRSTIEKAVGLDNLVKLVNEFNHESKQEDLQLLQYLRKEAGGHDELLNVVKIARLLQDFIEAAGGLYSFVKMLQEDNIVSTSC